MRVRPASPVRALLGLVAAIAAAGCGDGPRPAAAPGPAARGTEDVLRIYLARHGRTDWNAARRLQGGTDTQLDDTGREQAEALARQVAELPIERVYSSALRRSRETAEIAAAGRIPVESLAGLDEQSLGRFEGLYVDGRDPAGAAEYERRTADPDDALDGGESRNAHAARVAVAFEELRRRHPRGSILIVGHGGTNVALLRAALGLTADEAAAIHQANDEVYLLELGGAAPRLWKHVPRERLREL